MRFEITAPARAFIGEVAGVRFSGGRATADDGQDQAALGYFRRKGYTIVPVDEPEAVVEDDRLEPEPEQDAGPAEPPPGPEDFDPGAHSVDEVLDYLDRVDTDVSERVIAAEQAGKARKTILARAGTEQGDQA